MRKLMVLGVVGFIALMMQNSFAVSSAAPKSSTPAVVKASAAPVAKAATGDTLIVIARLTEIAGKLPPNDLYNYVYIMKYRMVRVEKGTYAGQDLLVGVYNPLIPRSQIKDKMSAAAKGDVSKFEMGAKHRLVLVKPIEKVWNDAVEDEYMDSDLDKYYAVRVDAVKN